MAIPLYGSTGALFNRLGLLGGGVKLLYAYQQAQYQALTNPSTGVVGQYNSEPDLQAVVGSSYQSQLAAPESVAQQAANMATLTINRMVFRDNPRISQNLNGINILGSVAEVIRQMGVAGATILQMTVGTTPTAFVGTGNGVVLASVKRPFDGKLLENAYAETLLFTCSADSYTGGQTAGNESFTVTGTGSEPDVFAFDWPLGSNASTNINAINGQGNNSQGNYLTNSDFDSFTVVPNVPDNWTLNVGTAGTTIAEETSVVFAGSAALKFIGNAGGTLTNISQQFSSNAGTGGTLSPQSQYSVNLWARTTGSPPAAGVLTIDLIDQNNNVIADQAGVPNSFTINLTGLNTVYTPFNGVFRTPEILPTNQFIRLHLTTALTNGATVYFDDLSMGAMTQLYSQGPFVSCHSGNTPFVASPVADYATVVITNSRGAGGTLSTWQTLLFQLLNSIAVSNEILWPSSASPSIPDSAIQS